MTDPIKTDALDNYRRVYRDFRWETPEYFNFAATIDKFAEDPHRVAILWEDSEGRRARLTFADIARAIETHRERSQWPWNQARRRGPAGAAANHPVASRVYRCAQARRDRHPMHLDAAREGFGLSREPFRRTSDNRLRRKRNDGCRTAQGMPQHRALFHRRRRAHRMDQLAGIHGTLVADVQARGYEIVGAGDLLLHFRHDARAQGGAA